VSDYLLYQPDFPADARLFVPSPDQYGLPFEELSIQTKDRVKLHAYLIKQKLPSSRNLPTVIFFHGNAGNIGNRYDYAAEFGRFKFQDRL
jgi:predicted alpha/beta-fold hydrolase